MTEPIEMFGEPLIPFIEKWSVRVIFRKLPSSDDAKVTDINTKDLASEALSDYWHRSEERMYRDFPGDRFSPIQLGLMEIVKDQLASPDFEFFVTDYYERSGSWEAIFVVVGAFYAGICGYGSFRQGLREIDEDIRRLASASNKISATVRTRFQSRIDLSKKKEPWLKRSIRDSDGSS